MNARITFPTFALAAATLFGAASVAPAVIVDSSTFDNQYNGDAYPVPGYTNSAQPSPLPSTNGNILSYDAPVSQAQFTHNSWAVTSNDGYTIEFSVKINDTANAQGSGGTFAVAFGDGSAGDIFSVGTNFTKVGNNAVTANTAINTDAQHLFRITVLQDGGGIGAPTINFYRDAVLIHTWANGGNFASNVLIWGGIGSTYGGGGVELDYFRWDNDGAYEPPVIPEPTSLALIACGGLLAMRRRR